MLDFVSSLLAVLCLVSGSAAQQFGSCDYVQDVVPGRQYYIFNTNYPQFYRPGSTCRWVARSNRPLKLTCNPFELPPSNQCTQDSLTILDAADASVGHRYCGNGAFNFTTQSNQVTVTLATSAFSQGGRFSCTVETVQDDGLNNCRCGWKNPSRIVGGEETGVNEYPMMAGLVDTTQGMVYCGATIINNKQVLTAAHCLGNRDISTLGVLIGDHDLNSGSETTATKLYRVDRVRINPQYNQASQDNDLALITVRGTITFSQQVGPACLPFQHFPDTFAGNFVDVLGWGSTEFAGPVSSTLMKARLSVITNVQCRNVYAQVTSRQLCTYADGKDSCQFDSGGPVLWRNPTTQRVVLVGVINLGGACAAGEPAVNSRVGAYLDWIVANTEPGSSYCRVE